MIESVSHSVAEEDESNQNTSYESEDYVNEDAYTAALGTRPALPHRVFDPTFLPIIGIFACCTEMDYKNRPNAEQVVHAFEPIAKQLKVVY